MTPNRPAVGGPPARQQPAAAQSPAGIAARLAGAADFRHAYLVERISTALRPLIAPEVARAGQIAGHLRDALGLDEPAAATQARRSVLCHRELLLHQALILDLPVDRLALLLDTVTVEGLERLAEVPPGQGVLLLSLHYGLYDSLLPLALGCAAARGQLRHLTMVFDSGGKGSLGLSDSRLDEVEAAGLWRRSAIGLLDLAGGRSTARTLLARLRAGGAVLLLPDSELTLTDPASPDDQSIVVRVGQRLLSLPPGAAWLARRARCAVAPVHISPAGDGHAVRVGRPAIPRCGDDVASYVQASLQGLLEQAVRTAPGPWAGWPLLRRAETTAIPHKPTVGRLAISVPCGLSTREGDAA